MRFLVRGLIGLVLFSVTFGAIGFGVYRVVETVTKEETRRRPPIEERSYSVNTAVLTPESVNPVTTVYGQIRSWRNLEIRASSEGRIVELAEGFRDGQTVQAGDVLVKIDPADAESRLLDAKAALADAEAQKAEAEEAIVAAEQELEATRRQLDLRSQALERQKLLLDKGYATMAQVEQEELSLAAMEQSVGSRLQSIITARKRIERMDLTVQRAEITLRDAQRTLNETAVRAPFAGLLDQVDATLGRRVSSSEAMAVLIDPTALEASFTLSTAEFARFLDGRDQLIEAPVSVELDLGGKTITASGHLERFSAVVAEGDAGRLVFASLDEDFETVLRPGDFVTVKVQEPELENVARVPAAAINGSGELLVLDDDQRLAVVKASVLRRLGDEVILGDVPFGMRYVSERLPQLGPGLKVTPRGETSETGDSRPSASAGDNGASDMVALDTARREQLIARLNQSGMPDERKSELIQILQGQEVPRQVIERLENGGGRGQRS